ncbi:MAG: hypothetical protein ABH841_00860 [Candidatus Nealsonbacteria bacterium]
MSQETLESKSLWCLYKKTVWSQKSEQTAVVHNVMRVLRAIRNSRNFAYVSVPVTTGKFFYELTLRCPSMPKQDQLRTAIDHNYLAGWAFVEDLKKRKDCPILYPSDLIPVHQQWEQIHFQALWLSIIGEKCTEVHMGDGWEFSNGGSEEFTHVMQLRLGLPKDRELLFFNTKEDEKKERERMRSIKIYDHKGVPLSVDDGIKAIEGSLFWLRSRNFKAERLKNCLELLHWTKDMINEGFYQ